MPGLENSKGRWCFVKPMICQEGFCHECNIYLKISDLFTSMLEEKTNFVKDALDKVIALEYRQNGSSPRI